MITYAVFKSHIETLLCRYITNDEMVELCGEPLLKLLREKEKESKHNANATHS